MSNLVHQLKQSDFIQTRRKRIFFQILSVTLQGEEIIVVIPWEEWWELALKDSSNPQIALLPLHPHVRARFNYTAAWAYARSMTGKPYGYHNMIFSWIDTITDNFPPPIDVNLVLSLCLYQFNQSKHRNSYYCMRGDTCVLVRCSLMWVLHKLITPGVCTWYSNENLC